MAVIRTVARSAVAQAPANAVSLDSGALSAPSRALAGLGQDVAQIGALAANVAARRQDVVNQGILASEQNIRLKTAAEVEAYMASPEGMNAPEQWAKFKENAWNAYQKSADERAKKEGWGKQVAAANKIDAEQFLTRADITFNAKLTAGMERKSNAQKDALAETYANNGDYEGAAEVIASTSRFDDQKKQMIGQVISGGIYHQYDRALSDISQLPLAEQQKQLAVVESDLTAETKEGYKNGKALTADGKVIGSLTQQGRIDLIRQTRARQRAVESGMTQVGQSLVRQAELGVDPAMAFQKALEAGQITEDVARVFVPEVNEALQKKAAIAEEKAMKADERLGIRRDRAEATAERMIDARTGATLTMDEIERREARGITRPNDPTALTADAAARLRERLTAVEQGDTMAPEFIKVNERLENMLGQGVMGTWFRDAAQMAPAEKSRLLESINATRVSVGAKLKLMDKFLEVQKWDLREGEISDKDGDRNIGPEEKELRTSMIETYRQAGTELGPRAIGARYMADMQQVSDWFRANKNASPQAKQAKAKEFYEKTRKAVDDESSTAILRTIPLFQ